MVSVCIELILPIRQPEDYRAQLFIGFLYLSHSYGYVSPWGWTIGSKINRSLQNIRITAPKCVEALITWRVTRHIPPLRQHTSTTQEALLCYLLLLYTHVHIPMVCILYGINNSVNIWVIQTRKSAPDDSFSSLIPASLQTLLNSLPCHVTQQAGRSDKASFKISCRITLNSKI